MSKLIDVLLFVFRSLNAVGQMLIFIPVEMPLQMFVWHIGPYLNFVTVNVIRLMTKRSFVSFAELKLVYGATNRLVYKNLLKGIETESGFSWLMATSMYPRWYVKTIGKIILRFRTSVFYGASAAISVGVTDEEAKKMSLIGYIMPTLK